MADLQGDPFYVAFQGSFVGMMQWEQLDALWSTLRNDAAGGWYLYAVGETPPVSTATAEQVVTLVTQLDALLRKEHDETYCGIVYVDNMLAPSFVKIFDPNNLGVSCGYSDNPPLPGWVLSKLRPIDLPRAMPPPAGRRRWWQRVFGGSNNR